MIAKPRGATLSEMAADIDLLCRIENFLYERQVPNGGSVDLDVHCGTVVVSGKLPDAHAKWLCIECCRHVAGVIKLVDHVDVAAPKRAKRAKVRP